MPDARLPIGPRYRRIAAQWLPTARAKLAETRNRCIPTATHAWIAATQAGAGGGAMTTAKPCLRFTGDTETDASALLEVVGPDYAGRVLREVEALHRRPRPEPTLMELEKRRREGERYYAELQEKARNSPPPPWPTREAGQ